MPTITVSAPRSFVMCAMLRKVRTAKESMTSSTVTSTITPRERKRPTRSTRSSRNPSKSASVSAAWIEAIRIFPCLSIGTAIAHSLYRHGQRGGLSRLDDLISEQPLGFLDTALQVAHGVELAQINAQRHQCLRDLGRQPGNDDGSAHKPGRIHGLNEMIGD